MWEPPWTIVHFGNSGSGTWSLDPGKKTAGNPRQIAILHGVFKGIHTRSLRTSSVIESLAWLKVTSHPNHVFFPLQYKCFLSTNPLNHPQMFRKTTISALRFLSSGRFGYCAADAHCDVRPAVPNSGTWVAVLPVGFAEFRGTLGRKWRWRTTPVGNWFEFYSLLISSYFRSQAEVN